MSNKGGWEECLGSDQIHADEVIQLTGEGSGHRCQMQATTQAPHRAVATMRVSNLTE